MKAVFDIWPFGNSFIKNLIIKNILIKTDPIIYQIIPSPLEVTIANKRPLSKYYSYYRKFFAYSKYIYRRNINLFKGTIVLCFLVIFSNGTKLMCILIQQCHMLKYKGNGQIQHSHSWVGLQWLSNMWTICSLKTKCPVPCLQTLRLFTEL